MNRFISAMAASLIGAAGLVCATSAHASLTVFQTYSGSYGLSTDGGGSVDSSYGISAFVPVGATVTAAYLYQSTYDYVPTQDITLDGNALTFAAQSVQDPSLAGLASARSDVTSIVSPIINGGAGGTYNFTVGEGNSSVTDGTALVVVYSLASLPTQTVAILDGFSTSAGDSTNLNFSKPIDPTAAGFTADMRLGIGFSYDDASAQQTSIVKVNGGLLTANAGNYDDGEGANGALITVGGNDDPVSPPNPDVFQDHEHYNITPFLKKGDTSVHVDTQNPSGDDNIFLATFVVSGNAAVNAPAPPDTTSAVPEPATWATLFLGFGIVGMLARRRRNVASTTTMVAI